MGLSLSAAYWKDRYDLCAAERRVLDQRIGRVAQYDAEMSRLRLVPDGADYNILLELLSGKRKVPPDPRKFRDG